MELRGIFCGNGEGTLGRYDENAVFLKGEISIGCRAKDRILFYKADLQNTAVNGGVAINAVAVGVDLIGVVIGNKIMCKSDLVKCDRIEFDKNLGVHL